MLLTRQSRQGSAPLSPGETWLGGDAAGQSNDAGHCTRCSLWLVLWSAGGGGEGEEGRERERRRERERERGGWGC